MSSRRLFGVFYLCTLLFAPACAPGAPSAASQKAGEVEAVAASAAAAQPAVGAVETVEEEPAPAKGDIPAVAPQEQAEAPRSPAEKTAEEAAAEAAAAGNPAAAQEEKAPVEEPPVPAEPTAEQEAARLADEKANRAVVVDKEKAEVRVPCRFVNPTRQIEVFACHNMGPTHETVVEFDATGGRILSALQEIGCRSTSYWNGTSPGDFLRNQGDRVLVLVRWSHKGKKIELPAEAMLTDGETAFASFVRGFSFSAGPATGPDGKSARGVSRIAEITLGATQREQAVFSLLSHPTTLNGQSGAPGYRPCRALQPWSFPPLINTAMVEDLPELIESRRPAELIFRRVRSEVELLRYSRSIVAARGLDDRLKLYESLEPVAAGIDALKKSYEEILAEIADLIALDLSQLPEECRKDFALRGGMLQALGQWYCSRIQQEYFLLYQAQEESRLEWLRSQEPNEADREAYAAVLKMTTQKFELGLQTEVKVAGDESLLSANRISGEIISVDIHLAELSRVLGFTGFQLEEIGKREASLDPSKDAYLLKLMGEEKRRFETSRAILAARHVLGECFSAESSSRRDGGWEAGSLCIRLKKNLAMETLHLAFLKTRLLSLDENIRWEEGDSDDGEEGVSEREKAAKEKLAKLQKDRKSLEATVSDTRARLEKQKAKVAQDCKD